MYPVLASDLANKLDSVKSNYRKKGNYSQHPVFASDLASKLEKLEDEQEIIKTVEDIPQV